MYVAGLPIPDELVSLIRRGRWPRNAEEAQRQNDHPVVGPDRIRRFDPQSPGLYLYPPPFVTLQQRVDAGETFWLDPMSAPSEIWHPLTVDLGDFGIGFDSAVILDYTAHQATPTVKYLKWGTDPRKTDNHWVVMAESFAEFAAELGL